MKRIHTLFALVAAAAALVSCREDNGFVLNVPPTVDVTAGADIAFKAVGGTGSIEVAPTEGQLQAATAQSDWCHLTVSGNRIDVTVDEYDGLESRYAIVDLKAGEAIGQTIVQQFGVIVKSFEWKSFTAKNERQTVEFSYDALGSTVVATTPVDWITFEATPEKLLVHIDQNPTTDYREAPVHWNIGSVQGDLIIGQFDLAAAGLLGDWNWHGKQQPNNRDFPMNATLSEMEDGTYTLALTYATNTIDFNMKIENVVLEANKLLLPLGGYVGTYYLKRTDITYHVFPIIAAGTSRLYYSDAITEGNVPFVLGKDDAGQWQAVGDLSAWPGRFFRFEMWSPIGEEYEEEHEDISKSGLALADPYMEKK